MHYAPDLELFCWLGGVAVAIFIILAIIEWRRK